MKPYTTNKINRIKKAIDKALESGAQPIAAFDADGTLWDMDMGENFFHYQIKNKLLPDLPTDPLNYFQIKCEKNNADAFLWLVQINKNRTLDEIKKWAREAFDAHEPIPLFAGVKEIVTHLQKLNVKIFIVTASMKWAVEPAAELLGIPSDAIIGVTTIIKNGVLTSEPEGHMTWQEGKAIRLLDKIAPHAPFFCAGNTMGDLALLETATHIRLANCALPLGHAAYPSEQKLIEVAKSRNWFYHSF